MSAASTPHVAAEAVVSLSVHELQELVEHAAEQGAERAVERLLRGDASAPDAQVQLVSADALARELGVSRAHVYEHAAELGAVRLGKGPRARLRFDPKAARAALSRYVSEPSQGQTAKAGGGSEAPAPRRRRSLAQRRPTPGSILPSRPRETGA